MIQIECANCGNKPWWICVTCGRYVCRDCSEVTYLDERKSKPARKCFACEHPVEDYGEIDAGDVAYTYDEED